MATDATIVALSWRAGVYAVVEQQQFNGADQIDWRRLGAAHAWNDVSNGQGYQDRVMTLSQDQLEPFLVGAVAREFVARTMKAHTFVYLIHLAEWESGLSD